MNEYVLCVSYDKRPAQMPESARLQLMWRENGTRLSRTSGRKRKIETEIVCFDTSKTTFIFFLARYILYRSTAAPAESFNSYVVSQRASFFVHFHHVGNHNNRRLLTRIPTISLFHSKRIAIYINWWIWIVSEPCAAWKKTNWKIDEHSRKCSNKWAVKAQPIVHLESITVLIIMAIFYTKRHWSPDSRYVRLAHIVNYFVSLSTDLQSLVSLPLLLQLYVFIITVSAKMGTHLFSWP